MQSRDGVFLEDLCPKLRARQWRRSLHELTQHRCLYCGAPSESIDHVLPRSRGGISSDENCVPACLPCNGNKGDHDAFTWYRSQSFYDPRRAMALRAWLEGDRPLAQRLLSWTSPSATGESVLITAADPHRSLSSQATGSGSTALGALAEGTEPRASEGQGAHRNQARQRRQQRSGQRSHQTRQASTPLWRWQIAS
jgi:HNH endonuclease